MTKILDFPRLININHSKDNVLAFLEVQDLGFVPYRIYYLKQLETHLERGHHAHKKLKQVLVATSGSFVIDLEGCGNKFHFTLNDPNQGLYIPPGYYRILKNFSQNAVCVVFASDKYDETDYIRDYQDFKLWEEESRTIKKVDYAHIDRELEFLEPAISIAIKETLRNAQLILGPKVQKFEEEFAHYCGTKYAVAVANGLDAIRLILKALDISSGDEVIVPSHTFIATALAVHDVGAKPVFVDMNFETYNIDISQIENLITKNTKAIIAVHMHGLPCDMKSINEVAKKYNLKVIEDSAQAHGAVVDGIKCGNLSDAAAFSLYPTKNLGCYGDGGIITTSDSEIAEKLYALRNYGSKIRYQHDLPGINSRLDEVQAAILLVKLPYLNEWNERRIVIANKYILGLGLIKDIILPKTPENMKHIYHHFIIRLSSAKQRDMLQQYLKDNNITTVIHYPKPLHLEKLFVDTLSAENLINSELFSETSLSLPISPFITDMEVQYVIDKISDFLS